MHFSRRELFRASALPVAGLSFSGAADRSLYADPVEVHSAKANVFKIGLCQASLNQTIRAGEIELLDYPSFVMDTFGIEQIEMVEGFLPDVDVRLPFLEKIRARAAQAGTNIFMMMVDPLRLRSDHPQDRTAEVQRFHQLVDQTAMIGATYLRTQLDCGKENLDAQAKRAVEGLKRVTEYAATKDVSIAVEPGRGLSRNGLWLTRVIKQVNHLNCVSLPDFGKFGKFDGYVGIGELIKSASVIAAKSHAFHEAGLELQGDYPKQFQMIRDVGFDGIVSIEFEGEYAEVEGVRATHMLLQRLQESCTV